MLHFYLKNILYDIKNDLNLDLMSNLDNIIINIDQKLRKNYSIAIHKKTLINQLIITTSFLEPKLCINLLNEYHYDYRLNFQAIYHIYNLYCIKQKNNEIFCLLFFCFIHIFLSDEYLFNKQFKISINRYKKIIFTAFNFYIKMPSALRVLIFFMGLISSIYNLHISQFSVQDRKLFINLLFKAMLIDITDMTHFVIRQRSYIKFNAKPYIIILDLLFSNWNLLRPGYKKILKKQIKKRITLMKYAKNTDWYKSIYGNNYIKNLLRLAEVL